MRRSLSALRFGLILVVLIQAGFAHTQSKDVTTRPRRVAVFGSSVANGTGDEFGKEGYTGLLRELLAPRGWEVLNQSKGGDTTKTMAPRFTPAGTPDPNTRYLLPVHPGYVVIALSLANEGIWEAKSKEEKDRVFQQYADGIKGFVDRSRQNNIVPVVALVYPRMAYTPIEYEYVRRMNLLQNSWDVPTVNLLGALDDGAGRYTRGFDFDDKHPNAAGHREFSYAFVPSLFDALDKGKPMPSIGPGEKGFARITGGIEPLTFSPAETMHSFALSFMVRTQGDGAIAAVRGSTLAAKNEMKKAPRGNTEFESITLTADQPFTNMVGVQNGRWTYKSEKGATVRSDISAGSVWHHILLSHYTARGETLFYVDGKLAGKVSERLQPSNFIVGGSGLSPENGNTGFFAGSPKQADYKDLYLFRAALNSDEAAALHEGKLLQASLEIYAPLNDTEFKSMFPVANRAQSLSAFIVGPGHIVHTN